MCLLIRKIILNGISQEITQLFWWTHIKTEISKSSVSFLPIHVTAIRSCSYFFGKFHYVLFFLLLLLPNSFSMAHGETDSNHALSWYGESDRVIIAQGMKMRPEERLFMIWHDAPAWWLWCFLKSHRNIRVRIPFVLKRQVKREFFAQFIFHKTIIECFIIPLN